jgi:rod shape-determining protein MreD
VRGPRVWVAALCLVAALVLRLSVLARLHLPLGPPDLVLVVLGSAALVLGPGEGAALGFGIGLVGDLLSDHTLGRLALVLCVVGYGIGLLRDEAERSTLVPLAVIAGASAVSVLGYAVTGEILGDPQAASSPVLHRLAGAVLYDLLLTPFIFPLVSGLMRRLAPERR